MMAVPNAMDLVLIIAQNARWTLIVHLIIRIQFITNALLNVIQVNSNSRRLINVFIATVVVYNAKQMQLIVRNARIKLESYIFYTLQTKRIRAW